MKKADEILSNEIQTCGENLSFGDFLIWPWLEMIRLTNKNELENHSKIHEKTRMLSTNDVSFYSLSLGVTSSHAVGMDPRVHAALKSILW